MTYTFGPELDAELAYRRELLALHGPGARRGRSWLGRLLKHGDDPVLHHAQRSGAGTARTA